MSEEWTEQDEAALNGGTPEDLEVIRIIDSVNWCDLSEGQQDALCDGELLGKWGVEGLVRFLKDEGIAFDAGEWS